jgi:DNA-binding NtrC family response regulator
MTDTILLIDADEGSRRTVGDALTRAGCEVLREGGAAAGLAAVARARPDVVVLDLAGPEADGELIERLRVGGAALVGVTPPRDSDLAAAALRTGAAAVVPRAADPAALVAVVRRAARAVRAQRLGAAAGGPPPDVTALGSSPAMRHLTHQLRLLAGSDAPVLISGEPGTGKGWVARLLHSLGPRAAEPFAVIACAGQPPAAIETDAFGQEAGAGPDAPARQAGRLELAAGGTVLFDEVGALPLELQPRLLHLLDAGTFRRRGGTRDLPAGVRVVAATSLDLVVETQAGHFREALYYRLSVNPVRLPPVRERAREDRVALISALIADLRPRIPGSPPACTPDALERLLAAPWPGNVRELRIVLERALVLARGAADVGVEHLPGDLRARGAGGERRTFQPVRLEELERAHIERALRHFDGNRTRTARALGISRATLINKIKTYGLER